MFDQHRRRMSSKALLAVGVLFLAPAMARSQGAQSAAASNAPSSSADLTNEVRALAETVRELQAQVRSLNLQLSELRAKPKSAGTRRASSRHRRRTSRVICRAAFCQPCRKPLFRVPCWRTSHAWIIESKQRSAGLLGHKRIARRTSVEAGRQSATH